MGLLTPATLPVHPRWSLRANLHLSLEGAFVLNQVKGEASGSLALHANPKIELHSAENYTGSSRGFESTMMLRHKTSAVPCFSLSWDR